MNPHVRTCTPLFHISQTAGRIAFKFFCVNRDPFDKSFTHVWGGVHLHVRTCTPRFPDLANGLADRVQILCVNRDPLDKSFTHVWGGVHLHVRTCTPLFHISRMAGWIAFKFAVCLAVSNRKKKTLDKWKVGCICTCARAYPFCIFLKQLVELCCNLVCGQGFIRWDFNANQRWGATARAHVHTHYPYLANGWADCV